jgi:hypothetical protein
LSAPFSSVSADVIPLAIWIFCEPDVFPNAPFGSFGFAVAPAIFAPVSAAASFACSMASSFWNVCWLTCC